MSNVTSIFGPDGFVVDMKPPARGVMPDAETAFIEVLREEGFRLEAVIANESRIQRCDDADDKPGRKTGWYWLRTEGPRAVGCYGTWRVGGSTVWVQGAHNGDNRLSAAEQLEIDRLIREAREAREADAANAHERAADYAAELLATCPPASADHPYLAAKGVGVHGIHQLDRTLIVPRITVDGELHSVQFISDTGEKRYQGGGRVQGTFLPLGLIEGADKVALVEGYSTGASIHQATGWCVLVCFDSGNLTPVARAVREQYPSLRIIMCADDDSHLDVNAGLISARAAADAVGGAVISPKDLQAGETDYNDLGQRLGAVALGAQCNQQAHLCRSLVWSLNQAHGEIPPPLLWPVDGWLVTGYLNLFAADGGTGKTTIAQQLASCFATGKPWFGQTVTPGPVLLVLCEDDRDAILRRQRLVDSYLDLTSDAYLHEVHVMARLAESNFLAVRDGKTGRWIPTEFFQDLLEWCREHRPSAVILDSLSDVYPGSEIDRAEVSNFVSMTFARLAAECQTAVVVLAHTPKANGTQKAATYSGSTAWNNKARVRISLGLDEGSTDRLTMKLEKSNYGPTGAKIALRRFAGVVMRSDEHPEAMFSDDSPEHMVSEAGRCEDAVMHLMRICAERGERVSPKVMSNNFGPRMFLMHYQKYGGYAFTRTQYSEAMDRLLKAGKLEIARYGRRDKEFSEVQIAAQATPWSVGNEPVEADEDDSK